MTKRNVVAALMGVALVGIACGAAADAIESPPACPPGATGQSSHSGTYCAATPCTTDAECTESGRTCAEWRVCTRSASVMQGGRRIGPPTTFTALEVVGTCAPSANCRGDEEPPPPVVGTLAAGPPTCTVARYCVPPSLPGLPPTRVATAVVASQPMVAPGTPQAPTGGTLAQAPTGGAHGCGCRVASAGDARLTLAVALGVVALVSRRRARR